MTPVGFGATALLLLALVSKVGFDQGIVAITCLAAANALLDIGFRRADAGVPVTRRNNVDVVYES
jgi:hypothetical protein